MTIADVLAGRRKWALEQGDCRDVLKTMPAGSVQVCVTSPPYYQLRRYLASGHPDDAKQIGLEDTPELFIAHLVSIFREVRRVLRDDGTLWVNMGSSYSGSGKGAWKNKDVQKETYVPDPGELPMTQSPGFPAKCLIPTAWMLGLAMIADGWILRSDIVWNKPSSMPSSVTDRPTVSHEYVLLFAKLSRYFYDAVAVAEPAIHAGRLVKATGGQAKNADAGLSRIARGFTDQNTVVSTTRNLRTVWTINPEPLGTMTTRDDGGDKLDHFAAFPTKLVETMIKAGTSERGCCPTCGAPWRRLFDVGGLVSSGAHKLAYKPRSSNRHHYDSPIGERPKDESGDLPKRDRKHTSWSQSCSCPPSEPVGCVVLDPFGGSGTSALVALRLGRRAIHIDLSSDYIRLAERRIVGDNPMFNRQDVTS